jgi:poly-gamma-glutamate system protein
MKGVYWRPRKISRLRLVVVTLLALAGLVAVQSWPRYASDPFRLEKLRAANEAARGMDLIKRERQQRGHVIDSHFDPAETGLIGESMSLVTSVPGNLRSKQTSVNPNFAAAVVQMLHDAGVEQGDLVAVGCSGSFPALNLAVYSALKSVGAQPLIVASVAASQFGANMPDMMWIDMERLLYEQGHVPFRTLAASCGGYEDCGRGMCAASRQLILDAVERNGLELIDESRLSASIQRRMQIYQQAAGRRPIAAYINIGGGAASVGRTAGKERYRPGLNLDVPETALEIDSVMTRFARAGVPVIHLVEVNQLAATLGLPEAPHIRPEPGTGPLFHPRRPRRWLATIVLLSVVIGMRYTVGQSVFASFHRWLLAWRTASHRGLRRQTVETNGMACGRAGEWMV